MRPVIRQAEPTQGRVYNLLVYVHHDVKLSLHDVSDAHELLRGATRYRPSRDIDPAQRDGEVGWTGGTL
jgi:hypothetical protein